MIFPMCSVTMQTLFCYYFPLGLQFFLSLLLYSSATGLPLILYHIVIQSVFFVLCIVANLTGRALELTKRTPENLHGNI